MKIEPTKLGVHESEFNPAFILNVLPKIEWAALVKGARDVINKIFILNYFKLFLNYFYFIF